MSFAGIFCRFLRECRFEDLSEADVTVSKRALLDGAGVGLAGIEEESARKALAFITDAGARGPSRVLGTRIRTHPTLAAWANGILCHALDFDDVNHPMMAHPTAVLLPVILALADRGGVSGKEAIVAYAVGLELGAKLGRIVNPWHYEHGWHATGTLGTLAAAAAASRLLRLKPSEAGHALGLSASLAAGLRRNFGSMAKPLHAGHAARCGIEAALLAASGFTASREVMEGPMGMFALFGNMPSRRRIDRAAERVGRPFELTASGLSVKQYPCCAGAHPALDALLFLRGHATRPLGELSGLSVRVHPLLPRMMIYDRPADPMEAKFSARYCLAAAMADGSLTLRSFDPACLAREEIVEWMDRIELRPDLGEEGKKGEIPTRSEVHFVWQDGRRDRKRVEKPLGSPGRPLSAETLEQKFRDCARVALPERRIEGLIPMFRNLDDLDDLRKLTSRLAH